MSRPSVRRDDLVDGRGGYQRSYRLPSDTRTMTTDGETFYVIEETGYPSVLALRPRRDGAPTVLTLTPREGVKFTGVAK